jgi:hypothetical protein
MASVEGEPLTGHRWATSSLPGPSPVSLRIVNPLQDPEWDRRVSRHRDACFFHGAAWAEVLQASYRQTPLYCVAEKQGEVVGLLPVVEVRSALTGCRGVSLAFADLCPPLCWDPQTFDVLLQQALACGASRGWTYFEGRGGLEWLEQVPSWARFYEHTLDLTIGEEQLWKSFEGRARNAMRKAESSGVQVEIGQSAQILREFYQLHCLTRRKHGVPPQPLVFFNNIRSCILARDQGIVAVARLDGAPVAAAVFFHLAGRVIYKFSASNLAAQHLRPNNLVMWEAIRWYTRAGAREMHFGRTSLKNEGLRRYKRGFNTLEEELRYYRFDLRQRKFLAGEERAPGWQNRVCSLLPLRVLRLAGAILYKHMS